MTDRSATHLLRTSLHGDPDSARELFPLVYAELHRLATDLVRARGSNQTLQPTALIHEAWIRLIEPAARADFESRQHFIGVAAKAMRSILVDRARRRRAHKHGGAARRIELDEITTAEDARDDEVLAVEEALHKLTLEDPELARLVELRFFSAFSVADSAEALGWSVPTTVRRWQVARTWLAREIRG